MLAPAGRHVRSRPSRPQRRRGRLAERLIEDGEAAVDLLLRRGQRRCQADGAEPRRLGGNEIESEFQATLTEILHEVRTGRPLLAVADELDAVQHAEAAHVADDLVPGLQLAQAGPQMLRSEEHTSELQSLMRISYAVFCLKK